MATPNKPTEEELKATEEEAIKVAEELEDSQQIPQDEEEVEDENTEVEETPTEEGEPQEEPTEEVEAEPSKELFKKKASASARENQKIYAKNRVINKALADAEDVPEPTEEELQGEFRDWDIMSEVEKTLAKETVISRNWRKLISEAKDQASKIERWNESVDEFIEDPKILNANPELEGKEDDFRAFATQETNNNVPFNILVGAFLHEQLKNGKPNKGRMFDRGSGGPNEKVIPKNGKISLEEARRLRESNYDLWKEKNAKGLIDYNL